MTPINPVSIGNALIRVAFGAVNDKYIETFKAFLTTAMGITEDIPTEVFEHTGLNYTATFGGIRFHTTASAVPRWAFQVSFFAGPDTRDATKQLWTKPEPVNNQNDLGLLLVKNNVQVPPPAAEGEAEVVAHVEGGDGTCKCADCLAKFLDPEGADDEPQRETTYRELAARVANPVAGDLDNRGGAIAGCPCPECATMRASA